MEITEVKTVANLGLEPEKCTICGSETYFRNTKKCIDCAQLQNSLDRLVMTNRSLAIKYLKTYLKNLRENRDKIEYQNGKLKIVWTGREE